MTISNARSAARLDVRQVFSWGTDLKGTQVDIRPNRTKLSPSQLAAEILRRDPDKRLIDEPEAVVPRDGDRPKPQDPKKPRAKL
jgi:hypothetical protein